MTKRIKIEITTTVGHCHTGLIKYRGKIIASTDPAPYGMRHIARERAEAIAAKNGWTVAD